MTAPVLAFTTTLLRQVRNTRIKHADPRQLAEAMRIFRDSFPDTEYPVGTILQLVPFEAMVKHPREKFPKMNGWEFFALDISASVAKIRDHGDVPVTLVGECSMPVKPSFRNPRPRTWRSPLLHDELPRGCGPSARSDELDLGRFALIRVTRKSRPFPQSASRRPLELRPRCSSRCSGTTVSTSACTLRLARINGVGEAAVSEHERGLAVSTAHDHNVAHYAAT